MNTPIASTNANSCLHIIILPRFLHLVVWVNRNLEIAVRIMASSGNRHFDLNDRLLGDGGRYNRLGGESGKLYQNSCRRSIFSTAVLNPNYQIVSVNIAKCLMIGATRRIGPGKHGKFSYATGKEESGHSNQLEKGKRFHVLLFLR